VCYGSGFTEADFDREWDRVRCDLSANLRKQWKTGGDIDEFVIADDRSDTWTQCGGIYSMKALCPAFPRMVAEVLRASRHPREWSFHCVIELWVLDRSLPLDRDGEFVVRDGVIYIPGDDRCDYSALIG
jgi:hypothetical protein